MRRINQGHLYLVIFLHYFLYLCRGLFTSPEYITPSLLILRRCKFLFHTFTFRRDNGLTIDVACLTLARPRPAQVAPKSTTYGMFCREQVRVLEEAELEPEFEHKSEPEPGPGH